MTRPSQPRETDWAAIVHEHGAMVWRLARRLLDDEADAGDCFQETFVAAVSASRSTPVANWPGFLCRICTARAIDLLRRRIRDRRRTAPLVDALAVAAEGPPPAVRPDLLAQFRDADGGLGEPIDGKQVGTVAARGYRVKKKRSGEGDAAMRSMRVYVDPATELPVRVEEDDNAGESGPQTMIVLSGFEWDVDVDPSLVSLDPPAGYRREQVDVDALRTLAPPGGPQEAIASGLRFHADRVDGALPVGLDEFAQMAALMQTIDPEQRTKLPTMGVNAQLEFIKQQLGPWFALTQALGELENKKIQVHYLGKGLKAGDGSKLVAWWKAERPGRAIAIYDDFTWKEIDEPAAE